MPLFTGDLNILHSYLLSQGPIWLYLLLVKYDMSMFISIITSRDLGAMIVD